MKTTLDNLIIDIPLLRTSILILLLAIILVFIGWIVVIVKYSINFQKKELIQNTAKILKKKPNLKVLETVEKKSSLATIMGKIELIIFITAIGFLSVGTILWITSAVLYK